VISAFFVVNYLGCHAACYVWGEVASVVTRRALSPP
jgi:hypothetical protein